MIGSSNGKFTAITSKLPIFAIHSATTAPLKMEPWPRAIRKRLMPPKRFILPLSKPFRIAMIPASTDGVNYYRLATWAFEMRKYRNTIVDLAWFRYQSPNPAVLHTWQEDLELKTPSADAPGLTVGQYVRAVIDHFC